MSAADLMKFSPEVARARAGARPLVALELTIITHGMPYPLNVETARAVEEAVRSMGAVPATIAVIDGALKVGLDQSEIERLGQLSGGVVKASRRDLAAVAARKGSAGTTVAATMFVAGLAGIEIFATGGIGGVHRGAEETFDISADLAGLARTRVAVVLGRRQVDLSTSKRLSNSWRRKGSRSSAIVATNSPPFTRARQASSSTTVATACMISPAWSGCSATSAPAAS